MDKHYEALPEILKFMVTPKEFSWMSDEQRENLQDDFTNPDYEED